MNRLDFYNEMLLRENIRKAIRVVRKKRLAEERYVPGRAVPKKSISEGWRA